MRKKIATIALFAILLLSMVTLLTGVFAESYETRTFPVGTSVIPMDNHQGDRLKAFGFVHALLREGVTIFRIIEPPDVTLKTTGTPGGDIYAGGPILVEEPIPAVVIAAFPTVTVDTLIEAFTSDNAFRASEPTDILVILGIWGHTEEVLDWMEIPYTLTQIADVEADPGMMTDYDLVVVDCPGWDSFYGGILPENVATAIQSFAENGGEVIFTDRAFGDLALIFPGYVSIVQTIDGTWDFDVYNVGEFPSQYYGPSPVPIYTMGAGCIIDQTLDPNVRVILDIQDYGGEYRIGAFYFTYGDGFVEGFAYHPQEQTGESQVLSASLYGNKFIHVLPPPQIPVYVDIKPGSWPNPFNLKSDGVLPVAVCGTEDFDVTTIDPVTVQLTIEGVEEGVPPLRWEYEDAATPYTGEPGGGHDLEGDGYLDLTLKFKTQELRGTLGLDAFTGQTIPLILTGNLKEEHGGTPFEGTDMIKVRLPGDVDDNKHVDRYDYGLLAEAYGTSVDNPAYTLFADFNEDQNIDRYDYGILAAYYGKTAV